VIRPETGRAVRPAAERVEAHAGVFKRQRIAICHPVMVKCLIFMHKYQTECISRRTGMGKIYEYRTTVTIGDTNLLQHMYFVQFFTLQGITRDLWVKEVVKGGLDSIREGLVLITRSAQCEYKKDFFLYDKVLIQMQIRNIRGASVELFFKFYNEDTMELHAEGTNEIVFANSNHRVCRIPENFRTAGMEYSADE
jgi:enediyne core biosynthesis thioesterase